VHYLQSISNATEEYDGSSWTAGGTLNTARYSFAGCGIQTAALAFGGITPVTGATEEYDGSNLDGWRKFRIQQDKIFIRLQDYKQQV
jgi:hypothetical protein